MINLDSKILELWTLEPKIEAMLSNLLDDDCVGDSLMTRRDQMPMLKKKLNHAESIVMLIKDANSLDWRNKLADWWTQFALAEWLMLHPQDDLGLNALKTIRTKPKMIEASHDGQPRLSYKPPPPGLCDSGLQSMRIKLTNMFATVPFDIDSGQNQQDATTFQLKQLVTVIASVFKNFADIDLQKMAFQLAIKKLSNQFQESFYSHQESQLYSLFNFLRAEIEVNDDFNQVMPSMMSNVHMNISMATGGGKVSKQKVAFNKRPPNRRCNYCGHEHMIRQCPILRSKLCYRCYELGHTEKFCRNIPLFVR